MCRHLAYVGDPLPLSAVLTDPPGGLYEQSWAPRLQRHGTVNADGFGVGWYPPAAGGGAARPARYRRAVPIWADQNLPDLARTIHSSAVLAAVRDATPGTSQDESAAAPFRYDRWLFSHNGALPDWSSLPEDLGIPLLASELLEMEARCDSALLWTLIHRRLAVGQAPAEVLADVALATAAVRPGARLNLLLTDGESISAVRHGDTLWYRAVTTRGLDGRRAAGVVVAAEPDLAKGWHEVPDTSLLLVSTRAAPQSHAAARPAVTAGAAGGPRVRTVPLESVLTPERTQTV